MNNCRTNRCGKCKEYYCRGCYPKGCPYCKYGIERKDHMVADKYKAVKQEPKTLDQIVGGWKDEKSI